jgi:poly(A) polymerase
MREDPVRMLRAVRFAAKLGFSIDKRVEKSIDENRELLGNVPPARLFDEFLKLFQAGHALNSFERLRQYDLFRMLFPETDADLNKDDNLVEFTRIALRNTDKRVAAGKSVTPMFLLGVFLWAPVKQRAAALRQRERMSMAQSLSVASYEIAGLQQSRVSIPRRFTTPMREMLSMQPRFEIRRGKRALRLLEHPRFRAAYDFMMLRAKCGDFDQDLARFWTDVQSQDANERRKSFEVEGAPRSKKRRRPRKRRSRRKKPA